MAKTFHQLPSRTQVIVFALIGILAIFGSWQVLLGPEREVLATRRSRLDGLKAEVAVARATAVRLPAFNREVAALEISLLQTTAVLPDEKDPQDVLRNLHELASESSLELSSFTPKPIATKTQYQEWPIELGLEGGYHDLGRFFDRIATMSRLISVSNLNIKVRTKPNGRGSISASCVATTFVFKKDIAPTKVALGGKS